MSIPIEDFGHDLEQTAEIDRARSEALNEAVQVLRRRANEAISPPEAQALLFAAQEIFCL